MSDVGTIGARLEAFDHHLDEMERQLEHLDYRKPEAIKAAVTDLLGAVTGLAHTLATMDEHYTARHPTLGGPVGEAERSSASDLLAQHSDVGEADHLRCLELEEIADGAYGDGPLRRGQARRQLEAGTYGAGCDDPSRLGASDCDWGRGSHEQSFGGDIPRERAKLPFTSRQQAYLRAALEFVWENEGGDLQTGASLTIEEYLPMQNLLDGNADEDLVLLPPDERQFLRWAVYSSVQAQDSPPPAEPSAEALDDMLDRLGRPADGDEFENEDMRAERKKREGEDR